MIRLGLCCIFRSEPIKFRTTTATAMLKLERSVALGRISALALHNAHSLRAALQFCRDKGIGAFRVNSQILPLKTHPVAGYRNEELPDWAEIERGFHECGQFVRESGLRTSFHPDQFVVLNSPKEPTVLSSIAEIEYQSEIADMIAADVVNIHGGGGYGDKESALKTFRRNFGRLSDRAQAKLTVENDDTVYTPADLLPLCHDLGVPLVYDVHHHRCLPDGLAIDEATQGALGTWNREPLFHLSSPALGWDGPHPERHHDFIAIEDFPLCWRGFDLTVEVEAKAKEEAVLRLQKELQKT